MKMVKVFVIEGNIGSGKSNAMSKLENAFEQPLEKWTLLDKFYEDPAEYAFEFQKQVLSSYNEIIEQNKDKEYIIMESHPVFSVGVFAKLCFFKGWLTFDQYKELHDMMNKDIYFVFYLDVKSDVCLDRIAKRGRECEKAIDLDYLYMLDDLFHIELQNHSYMNISSTNKNDVVKLIKKYISLVDSFQN